MIGLRTAGHLFALMEKILDKSPAFRAPEFPVHLGLDATAEREPRFTGSAEWYQSYARRHAKDGAEGRLVAMHTFDAPWTSWEMHPNGAEIVVCVAGTLDVHQEIDRAIRTTSLRPGDAIINPPGVWHTADATEQCTALFITAGLGTQNRPR